MCGDEPSIARSASMRAHAHASVHPFARRAAAATPSSPLQRPFAAPPAPPVPAPPPPPVAVFPTPVLVAPPPMPPTPAPPVRHQGGRSRRSVRRRASSTGQAEGTGQRTTAAGDGARRSPAAMKRRVSSTRLSEFRRDSQTQRRHAPGARTSAGRRWQRRQRRRCPRRRRRLRQRIAAVSYGRGRKRRQCYRRRTRGLVADTGRGGTAALAAHAGAACDEPRATTSAPSTAAAGTARATERQQRARAFAAGDGALRLRVPAASGGHGTPSADRNELVLDCCALLMGHALLLLLAAGGCAARAAGASTAAAACDGTRHKNQRQGRFGPRR